MSLFKATAINSDYHYGMLGDFKVIIRTSDDYLNVTKLCADGGKEFRKWKSKLGPQRFLAYFDRVELKNDTRPDRDGTQREYKCLDIVDNTSGVPKETMGRKVSTKIRKNKRNWIMSLYTSRGIKIIESIFS